MITRSNDEKKDVKRGEYQCEYGFNQPNSGYRFGLCLNNRITENDLKRSARAKELKEEGVNYWPCSGDGCPYKSKLNKEKKVTLGGPPLWISPYLVAGTEK